MNNKPKPMHGTARDELKLRELRAEALLMTSRRP